MGSFGVWLAPQMLTYYGYAPLCVTATSLKLASSNKFLVVGSIINNNSLPLAEQAVIYLKLEIDYFLRL